MLRGSGGGGDLDASPPAPTAPPRPAPPRPSLLLPLLCWCHAAAHHPHPPNTVQQKFSGLNSVISQPPNPSTTITAATNTSPQSVDAPPPPPPPPTPPLHHHHHHHHHTLFIYTHPLPALPAHPCITPPPPPLQLPPSLLTSLLAHHAQSPPSQHIIHHLTTSPQSGITTILTLTKMGFVDRTSLPKLAYPVGMDYFVILCFTYAFAALFEFAMINYLERRATRHQRQMVRAKKGIEDRAKAGSADDELTLVGTYYFVF
ncbi:Gamma-aminobutyric acid receptor subunit alpha-4 [Portunus trituberculatus]|uniref:Gamma-aminobutyric acid receptor subunit alpha-4 n=1 Tax=Portunus trituberculatus TaxID=210409 RepID=A0A5B7GNY3_PORTR|nr:Gamma-aminobutyric acid receptor subunit alpha-4 [Portunus trituberculatus]